MEEKKYEEMLRDAERETQKNIMLYRNSVAQGIKEIQFLSRKRKRKTLKKYIITISSIMFIIWLAILLYLFYDEGFSLSTIIALTLLFIFIGAIMGVLLWVLGIYEMIVGKQNECLDVLEDVITHYPADIDHSEQDLKWRCSVCNMTNSMEYNYCVNCGNKKR